MAKSKFSFTLDGIKYTDISGYQYSGSEMYNISVSGTAQMIRQYMKSKYPNIPARNYYWVQSESYSGGDSINIYLNNAPEDFFNTLNKELNLKFEAGSFDGMTDSYTYSKSAEKSSEGNMVDYGTKYLFVKNSKPYGSDAPSVDWDAVLSKKSSPAPSRSSSSGEKKSSSTSETLKDCAGWKIFKVTLADGRIVYTAKIKPETSPNREDWSAIKGEIYTETGFKWGKFGAFEKWGELKNQQEVIDKLCNILGKYYEGGNEPAPAPTPEPTPSPEAVPKTSVEWADWLTEANADIWDYLNIKSASDLYKNDDLQDKYAKKIVSITTYIKSNIRSSSSSVLTDVMAELSDRNEHSLNNALGLSGIYGEDTLQEYVLDYKQYPESSLNPKYYIEEEKNVGLYVNGEFIQNVANDGDAYLILSENFGEPKFKAMIDNNQVVWDIGKNRLDVLRDNYEYGKKWGVPQRYGNQLQLAFIDRGYKVYISAKNNLLVIYKNELIKDGAIINDNGGEFNIDRYGYNENIGSVNYEMDKRPNSVATLANIIDEMVSDFFNEQKQEEPQMPQRKSKEEIEKAIRGLQILADKGNEKAIKAIKGLQYLLNK